MSFAVTGIAAKFYHAERDSLARQWYERGAADLRAGRPATALEDFRTALVYSRGNDLYQLRVAQALIAANQPEEARAYLLSLWERTPGSGIVNLELARLAERARSRKLTLDDMEGGVFTITNLGGIGGTAFSPIVNSPEVAILGLARAATESVFADGQFRPRLMLPLSLSYDHRLIDGADAARFLRWVAEALEQPFLLPLEG